MASNDEKMLMPSVNRSVETKTANTIQPQIFESRSLFSLMHLLSNCSLPLEHFPRKDKRIVNDSRSSASLWASQNEANHFECGAQWLDKSDLVVMWNWKYKLPLFTIVCSLLHIHCIWCLMPCNQRSPLTFFVPCKTNESFKRNS